MSAILSDLNWRYATKKFDPAKKLTEAQLQELLEALRLSASSYGLQPYKFLVITNPELRVKIRENAWGQPQVTDASHLIAICNFRTLNTAYIDKFVDEIATSRGVPKQSLADYRAMVLKSLEGRTPEETAAWAKLQTYIALGFLLTSAAQMKIDTCPMEGFDRERVDEVLDLEKENLSVATLCPVGFRAADDGHATHAKVRFPLSEMVLYRE